jgi:hypothetical protein
MADILFQVTKGIRADIHLCRGTDMGGKRSIIKILPSGKCKGTCEVSDCHSLAVAAPPGTEIILKTHVGDGWEQHPWRCIRIMKQTSVPPSSAAYLPTVRIPDLEQMDHFAAKLTDRDMDSSYPMADTLEEGDGWTFGRLGPIKGKIKAIALQHTGATGRQFKAFARRIVVFRAIEDEEEELKRALILATENIRNAKGCERAELYVTRGTGDQFTLLTEFAQGTKPPKVKDIDRLIAREPSVIDLTRIG